MAEVMRENEFVLAPGEYVFTSDQTTGKINTYVGPYKISLAGTDQPMIYDPARLCFERARTVKEAVKLFPYADERSYIVLHNPAANDNEQSPKIGTSSPQAMLKYGRKINVKGPGTFPLWPGQSANVIGGHQLKSNQYLIVKVYNEEEATVNWSKSVMQSVSGTDEQPKVAPKFVTGQLMIIKGTEVSFYIPPTGIEVMVDDTGKHIREAVTLERLEYGILLDESGDKRYVRGPAVVFPSPTEKFVELSGERKFRAIELNPQMGIHVKVIADYTGDSGKQHKSGEELHITGEDTKIYFPRAEHALIKYNDKIIQYAVAITAGEGRYVLDKNSGNVETVKGPKMFLPDPVNQVMVNRILSKKECALWFPGNSEALDHNLTLARKAQEENQQSDGEVRGLAASGSTAYYSNTSGTALRSMSRTVSNSLMENVESYAVAGDQMRRKSAFTPPRSITIDNKYEGAVRIDIWPGYAVQVVSKAGDREVVEGPHTVILDYDHTLELLALSRGTPKSTDNLLWTPYLQTRNNQVSDIIAATTSDLVDVAIRLSYRVNFEGDNTKWFGVQNYVKLLTDHLRSLVRNAIKRHGIEEINNNHITIIRDTILGESKEGKRSGRGFEENGMKVYDVEILMLTIGDSSISGMITANQHKIVQSAIEVAQKKTILEAQKRIEEANRELETLSADTRKVKMDIAAEEVQLRVKSEKERLDLEFINQQVLDSIESLKLERIKKTKEVELDTMERGSNIHVKEFVNKMESVSPDLIAAIQNAYGMNLAETVASNLPQASGTLGLLTGAGGIASLAELFKGTPMADAFTKMIPARKKNSKTE